MPEDIRSYTTSEFKSTNGFKRLLPALRYSLAGLSTAWRSEHAFRQELVIVTPLIILAVLLPLAFLAKIVLIAVLVLVLIVELINSAIEAVVDRISLERHPLSKNAKDFGSAAVLLAVCLAISTWMAILFPIVRSW